MTEFGTTLQAFIPLAGFDSQSAYGTAAGVSGSTVTRATSGISFSSELLAKLIHPFPLDKRAELVRAYIRDRLREGGIDEQLVWSSIGTDQDVFARFRPDVRMLCAQVGRALQEDPIFQRTIEDLLELIDEDARRSRLQLVAEHAPLTELPPEKPVLVSRTGKLQPGHLPKNA